MTLPVRVVVRTDVDWSSLGEASFAAQSEPDRPLAFIRAAAARGMPAAFRAATGVELFAYRGELAAITASWHATLPGVRVTRGLAGLEDWLFAPGDELLVPTDDDDLFSPRLSTLGDAIAPGADLILFPHVAAGHVDFERRPRVERSWARVLFTNNWGVRRSWLASLGAERARTVLADHRAAQIQALRRLGVAFDETPLGFPLEPLVGDAVQTVEECLSVDYMHPGSLQMFLTLSDGGRAARPYDALDLEAPLEIPPEIAWARGPLGALHGSLARLRGRTPAARG